jgi:CRISPR/Cas system endoribonuclease Cas6 (RAMP superfamily)
MTVLIGDRPTVCLVTQGSWRSANTVGCKEYGIEPKYDDVYWRLDHPMDAFKQEVERNLATKYEDYYDEPAPERPYLESFEPKKEVGVPLHYAEQEVQIVGTTWEFEYECQNRSMYLLMKMVYSAGLGS